MHKATDLSVCGVEPILSHEVTHVSSSQEAIVVPVDVFEGILHVEVDSFGQTIS